MKLNKAFCGPFTPCRACAPLLFGYLENQLDARLRARVEVHLSLCAACRADLATARKAAHLLPSQKATVEDIRPDLWMRVEAEIQKSPQPRTDSSGRSVQTSAGRRGLLSANLLWPQVLPAAASVFAAAILAPVLIGRFQHGSPATRPAFGEVRTSSGSLALAIFSVRRTGDGRKIVSLPHQSAAAAPGAQSAFSARQYVSVDPAWHRGITTREKIKSDGVRPESPPTGFARQNEVSAGRQRNIPQISFARARAGTATVSDSASISPGSSGYGQKGTLASGRNLSARSHQWIEVAASSRAVTESQEDTTRLASSEALPGSVHSASAYVASADRRSYAVDADLDMSATVADVAGSVQRQQGLFSYSER